MKNFDAQKFKWKEKYSPLSLNWKQKVLSEFFSFVLGVFIHPVFTSIRIFTFVVVVIIEICCLLYHHINYSRNMLIREQNKTLYAWFFVSSILLPHLFCAERKNMLMGHFRFSKWKYKDFIPSLTLIFFSATIIIVIYICFFFSLSVFAGCTDADRLWLIYVFVFVICVV